MRSRKKIVTVSVIAIIVTVGLFANLYLTGHFGKGDDKKITVPWENNTGSTEDIAMLDYGDIDFLNGGYYNGRLSSNVRIDGNIEDMSGYVGNCYKYYKQVDSEDGGVPFVYKGSEEYELIEEFIKNNTYNYKGGDEYYLSRRKIYYSVYSFYEDEMDLCPDPMSIGRIRMALGKCDANYRHADYLPYDMAEKFMNNYNAFADMDFNEIRYMAVTKPMVDEFYSDLGYSVMQREIMYNRLSEYGNIYYAECRTSMNGIKMAHGLYSLRMALSKDGVIAAKSYYVFRPDRFVYDGDMYFSENAVENALKECVSAVGGKCRGEAVIKEVGVYYYDRVIESNGKNRLVYPMIVITVNYDEKAVMFSSGAINQYRFYDIEKGSFTGTETSTGV